MNDYDIDVIIPVFNGEKYLAETLKSVQQQTLPPVRIIVVNDGSTDGTAQIIDSFQQSDPRILPLHLPQNSGETAARNAGIAASSAPFVAFLDADDIWLPEKLEAQVEVFQQGGPEIGFVYSAIFTIDAAGDIISSSSNAISKPIKRGDIFRPLLKKNFISGSASSVLVRRDVLDRAGFFDEHISYGGDWDLWIRLGHISHVDFTPKAVVGIRAHDQSASRRAKYAQAIEFVRQNLLVYLKWEEKIIDDRPIKHFIRQKIARATLKVTLCRRSPSEALAFYHSLTTHESPLANKLFHNALHFWLEVFFCVPRVLWRNIKRAIAIGIK